MAFVLKITGQNGEPYATVEGLSQTDAELLTTLARTLAPGSSWPVPACDCARCESRRAQAGGR